MLGSERITVVEAKEQMRSYLYVWNEPAKHRFIASGLEFKDLIPVLASGGGIYLLRHGDWEGDSHQGFDVVGAADLEALAAKDLNSWGDFVWADYPKSDPLEPRQWWPRDLSPESMAELLYFGHACEPLRNITIPGLGNRFLAFSHDDGWRLVLWYSEWQYIEELLKAVLAQPSFEKIAPDLREGRSGFWLEGGAIETEDMTLDIDGLLNRRHPS
jgi:hypothetical protein